MSKLTNFSGSISVFSKEIEGFWERERGSWWVLYPLLSRIEISISKGVEAYAWCIKIIVTWSRESTIMSCCPVKLQLDFDNSTNCSKIQASCKCFFAEREREMGTACMWSHFEWERFFSFCFFFPASWNASGGREGLAFNVLMYYCLLLNGLTPPTPSLPLSPSPLLNWSHHHSRKTLTAIRLLKSVPSFTGLFHHCCYRTMDQKKLSKLCLKSI